MKHLCLIVFSALMAVSSACAPLNPRLERYDPTVGYRFGNLSAKENADELFVVLAFSGGGTRAAAFSYGVLNALNETPLPGSQGKRTLLDEVDVISSVSGGSFTAAYYGLFGDRIFEDFEEQFLKKNIQLRLIFHLLYPWNWFKLMSPSYSRIDIAAEYYSDHIFGDATFGDLVERGRRPFIIINASDLSLGTRFEFTQRQFDMLGSDLSKIPVASAVAASSAFPGLLSPMAFTNYRKVGFEEPAWVGNAIENPKEISPSRYKRAKIIRSYFDHKARPYVHLVDGGVVDNLGLTGALLGSLKSSDFNISRQFEFLNDVKEYNLLSMINDGRIRRLVVIIVDAMPDLNMELDESRSTPGLISVIDRVASIPMREVTFRIAKEGWRELTSLETKHDTHHGEMNGQDKSSNHFEAYWIHLRFDELEDEGRRKRLGKMKTNFDLSSRKVKDLISAGGELLEGSKGFKQLLSDLKSSQ
ncbi:MAG: patatin-like phospholipase family protein [Planctomycetota bacterium]|nr:patatin-like phospholipase family protein [Planctomycetota bacterium]